jgi:hypothetical protein
MSDCEACDGLEYYPIHNKFGQELYNIPCPECCGQPFIKADAMTDKLTDLERELLEALKRAEKELVFEYRANISENYMGDISSEQLSDAIDSISLVRAIRTAIAKAEAKANG